MTDYTNTYPDLVNVEDWLNAKGYTGEAGACHAAMSLIRKQEARIEELEKMLALSLAVDVDALKARIAELEDKLKDEEYISKDTNEMFHEVRDENIDLRTRIAELKAELACSIVSGNDAHERALGYVYGLNDAAEMLANQARTLKEWHERIVELKSALREFNFYLILDSDKDTDTLPVLIGHIRAARASDLGEKE